MTRSHTTTPFAYYLFILFLVEFNVAKPEWTAKTDFIFPYIFKEFPGIFSVFSRYFLTDRRACQVETIKL